LFIVASLLVLLVVQTLLFMKEQVRQRYTALEHFHQLNHLASLALQRIETSSTKQLSHDVSVLQQPQKQIQKLPNWQSFSSSNGTHASTTASTDNDDDTNLSTDNDSNNANTGRPTTSGRLPAGTVVNSSSPLAASSSVQASSSSSDHPVSSSVSSSASSSPPHTNAIISTVASSNSFASSSSTATEGEQQENKQQQHQEIVPLPLLPWEGPQNRPMNQRYDETGPRVQNGTTITGLPSLPSPLSVIVSVAPVPEPDSSDGSDDGGKRPTQHQQQVAQLMHAQQRLPLFVYNPSILPLPNRMRLEFLDVMTQQSEPKQQQADVPHLVQG
jgi:hypothetical protein